MNGSDYATSSPVPETRTLAEAINAREAAAAALTRGYKPIPLPPREKGLVLKGWEHRTFGPGDFSTGGNFGIQTGSVSGGLADVDLDVPEAVAIGRIWLPDTDMIHGRPGNPRSHYWYMTGSRKTLKFVDPSDGKMLVELRSNGSQTMSPPSTHPKGERLRWERAGEPARLDAEPLIATVSRVSAGALVARHWKAGSRHNSSLALAGWLLRHGMSAGDSEDFLGGIAAALSEDEFKVRRSVRDTAEKFAKGEPTTGARSLRDDYGFSPKALDKVIEWLGLPRFETGKPGGEGALAAEERDVPESIPPEERLTDIGNARRFARQHRGWVRYCDQWRAWLVFDGKRWIRDELREVEHRAKQTIETMYGEAAEIGDDKQRVAMGNHALRSEAAGRIAAMIDLARSEEGIPVKAEEFDWDPWVLNVENGTLDLRSGTLREHRAKDLITKLAPVAYALEATCPKFEAFLKTIFAGRQDLIGFLQRAIGYTLTGQTSEQVLFILHGGGSNGKTTLERAIESMLGDYATATPPETLMIRYGEDGGPSDDVARLRGARFVSSIESEEGRRLAEAKIKQLTGGDKVVARHLYGRFFEFRPAFKLWFATNHLPTVRAQDEAIWRRILKIPFDVTIPAKERIPDFFENTLAPELAGILAWGVAGCLLWQKNRLQPPKEVCQATADYREDMDIVAAFIADRCHAGPEQRESAGRLHRAYVEWSKEQGDNPTNSAVFGRRLTEKGYGAKKSNGVRWRVGLSLRSEAEGSL